MSQIYLTYGKKSDYIQQTRGTISRPTSISVFSFQNTIRQPKPQRSAERQTVGLFFQFFMACMPLQLSYLEKKSGLNWRKNSRHKRFLSNRRRRFAHASCLLGQTMYRACQKPKHASSRILFKFGVKVNMCLVIMNHSLLNQRLTYCFVLLYISPSKNYPFRSHRRKQI